ncbi:rifin [Plasmodium falciparum IGH-CR14]|uniref:Rifin n=1 Tax=Plasmodium falciparum IGH-CR14 TaxID=580059 RepID=A0A0L1I6K8_PLAFA|nr:rifin [Plasmodium falciparum IGH-CR14]
MVLDKKYIFTNVENNCALYYGTMAHNKNKPYITPNTPTTTLRVLSECDLYMPNYDKDPDMKSVKENFDRQTSQRFEEYEERVQDKRKKCKEQCDKDIQEIIVKDKVQKSLAKKVEQGCLKCGCGLGGGVLPVWSLVSGLWYATWSQYVTQKALAAGIEKGIQVGLDQIIQIYKATRLGSVPQITVTEMLSSGKFNNGVTLSDMFEHIITMYETLEDRGYSSFVSVLDGIVKTETIAEFNTRHSAHIAAIEKAVAQGKAAEATNYTSITSSLTTGITASIIAIVVIVLVMIIIYLVLRYRRKKKMNKRAHYTKLLKE